MAGASVPGGDAFLRIWKAELPEVRSVSFTLEQQASGRGQNRDLRQLGSFGPGYQFNEYIVVPHGKCTLASSIGGQDHPFSALSVDLAVNSYSTLLVTSSRETGGSPEVELITDVLSPTGKDAKGTMPAQFCIRNLAAGVHDLRVSVGDQLTAQFVAGGGVLRMTGLKAAVYGVRATGLDADNKPFDWTTEGNFEQFPQQTLLVYPDAYGRIRPRLNVDGPSPTPAPQKPDEQS